MRLSRLFHSKMITIKFINSEDIIRSILFVFAVTSVFIILLIILFLFKEGLQIFEEKGLLNFILGAEWDPVKGEFGALPFILCSILITLGALIIAVPLGVSCAIFLVEIAPEWAKNIVRPAIELLAGIPSIVYGLFALMIIVRLIKVIFSLPTGETILAGSIILAIMILPIIISISQDSLEAVPREYKEGSLALGATDWQTIKNVLLPSAMPGIMAGTILGMGRAIGETMAVVLVLGNVEKIPTSLLEPGEALTSAILLEMGEAIVGSMHYSALFALGIVLFFIVLVLSLISNVLLIKYNIRR